MRGWPTTAPRGGMYQPAIYRYARSRSLQEADALEVMLAVHRAMDGWRPSNRAGSFRAWLADAARRITLQALKQRDKRDRGAGGEPRPGTLAEVATPSATAVAEEEDKQRWLFFCAAASV